jgi:phage FluMu protein Com
MLRVSCTCGKVLNVNEALAGKKIKCPVCATVLTVSAPAQTTAVSAKKIKAAVAPEEDDEGVASGPPPRKKAAAAGNGTAAPLPKKKKPVVDEDDDDEDDLPRPKKKKKKSKQGSNTMLLVLLGGGGAALLLLIGVGLLLYFLLSGGKGGESAGTDTAAKNEPIAVKFHVPLKVGDVRDISATYNETVKIDTKVKGPGLNPSGTVKASFQGKVKTLAVDAEGNQTKGEITIANMKTRNETREIEVPTNTIFIQESQNGGYFSYTAQEVKGNIPFETIPVLMELFGRRPPAAGHTADRVWGTTAKKMAGDSWSVNKAGAVIELQTGLGADMKFGEEAVKGTVKFESMSIEAGVTVLDFKGDFKVTASNFKANEPGMLVPATVNGTFDIGCTMRFPKDYKTGSIKTSYTTVAKATVDITDPTLGAQKVTVDATKTWSMTIKYLANDGGGGNSGKGPGGPKGPGKKGAKGG